MKVVLICIACNEDHYIDEWINYHKLIGVDEIFIYQNNWRCSLKNNDETIHLIEWDGQIKQLAAYNDFKDKHYNDFDFGIFIDCDEFVCLKQHNNIKEFLNEYTDFGGVGLNWKNFGDSHLDFNGNYNVLKRFTLAQNGLHKGIKTIINFNKIKNNFTFICAHCIDRINIIVNVEKTHYINGPFNETENNNIIQLNHYRKTRHEFIERRKHGAPDKIMTDKDIQNSINTQFDTEYIHYNNEEDLNIINYLDKHK